MTVPHELDGLIPADLADALAALAAKVPAAQSIVEIGSYRGKSTAFLAWGAKQGNGAAVIAVDPWDLQPDPGKHGYNDPGVRADFERQLKACRLWSRVRPVRAYSADAAAAYDGPPVGLLYVDGDHEHPQSDLDAWAPHLAADAVVALDDWGTRRNPQVARAAAAYAGARGSAVEVQAGRLAVIR